MAADTWKSEATMANKVSAVCPVCGGIGIPIAYGLPSLEAGQAAARGEVVLGGCEVTGEDPDCQCVACGVRWMERDPGRWTPARSVEDGYRPTGQTER